MKSVQGQSQPRWNASGSYEGNGVDGMVGWMGGWGGGLDGRVGWVGGWLGGGGGRAGEQGGRTPLRLLCTPAKSEARMGRHMCTHIHEFLNAHMCTYVDKLTDTDLCVHIYTCTLYEDK